MEPGPTLHLDWDRIHEKGLFTDGLMKHITHKSRSFLGSKKIDFVQYMGKNVTSLKKLQQRIQNSDVCQNNDRAYTEVEIKIEIEKATSAKCCYFGFLLGNHHHPILHVGQLSITCLFIVVRLHGITILHKILLCRCVFFDVDRWMHHKSCLDDTKQVVTLQEKTRNVCHRKIVDQFWEGSRRWTTQSTDWTKHTTSVPTAHPVANVSMLRLQGKTKKLYDYL